MRLLSAQDYERVFQQPLKSSSRAITVLARPSGLAWPRLGLAVSRKHIRRSTQRNRFKRLVRESFRRHQKLLSGLDVVVIGRAGLAGRTSGSVLQCLETHWHRISELSPSAPQR